MERTFLLLQIIQTPKLDSKEKLVACIEERAGYGEENMIMCSNCLQLLNVAAKGFRYHKECYKEVTNKTKIERRKQRFEQDRAKLSDRTDGQELTTERQIEKPPDEQNVSYSKCHIQERPLHFLSREKRRHSRSSLYGNWIKILDVAEKLQDMLLLLRLNNIPNASDAVANDVQYHRKCLVAAQRKANVEEPLPQELENVNRIAADIEIQDIVENIFKESTESVTDRKSLNTMYNNLLGTNEVNYLKMFQVCSLYVPLLETNLNEFVLPVAKAVLFKKTFEARMMTTKLFFKQQER